MQVSALYSHAGDRAQVVSDRMEEDRALAKLALSGVGAVAGAAMNLQPLRAAQSIRAVLNSKSEAGKKGSSVLCELSNHIAQNSEQNIKDSWAAVKSGGIAGGGLLGVTSTVGHLYPAAGAILSGFMAIPLRVGMVMQMWQMEKMHQDRDKTLHAKIAEAKGKLEKGEIPESMYRDIEQIVARERGKQTADRIGDGLMMASMVPHVPHTMMMFPEAITAEAIERAGMTAGQHHH